MVDVRGIRKNLEEGNFQKSPQLCKNERVRSTEVCYKK